MLLVYQASPVCPIFQLVLLVPISDVISPRGSQPKHYWHFDLKYSLSCAVKDIEDSSLVSVRVNIRMAMLGDDTPSSFWAVYWKYPTTYWKATPGSKVINAHLTPLSLGASQPQKNFPFRLVSSIYPRPCTW
jgi:hypothetical protein